jgi:hypothetical protein
VTDRPRFECDLCGWVSIPPPHVESVFHPCKASRSRRRLQRFDHSLLAIEERREADRVEWARHKLGPIAESLEDELGDRALLDVEDE